VEIREGSIVRLRIIGLTIDADVIVSEMLNSALRLFSHFAMTSRTQLELLETRFWDRLRCKFTKQRRLLSRNLFIIIL
jgi:hypothetical protein